MTILKVISYFSLFNYPLSKRELFEFSTITDYQEFIDQLQELEFNKIIHNINDYYFLEPRKEDLERRKKGNEGAKKIMPKAWEVGRFISKFPYVRAVCISGSLSKGYFDEKSDIDFFIISEKKRLWITRTFLILYKKLFLLNSKEFFCLNYFMSSGYLKVDEENRFTATEVATLIPLFGKEVFIKFTEENKWVNSFFPNLKKNNDIVIKDISKNRISRIIESTFNSKIGDFFEQIFMKITIKKWNKKFDHLSKKDFKIAFKSSENISKHHPQNFQEKVLRMLNKKYDDIEKEHGIKLDKEYA